MCGIARANEVLSEAKLASAVMRFNKNINLKKSYYDKIPYNSG